MFEDLLTGLSTPDPILLNISDLPRGVDNYHIDVKLSPRFCADFNKLLADFVAVETSQKPQRLKHDKEKDSFRDSYVDMMTVLINRVKTDLSIDKVHFLQFAVYRFMLESTQGALDQNIKNHRNKLSELRASGSGKALSIQDHLFWLQKNYNTILYAINRHFFVMLKQFEAKDMQALRRQYLGSENQTFMKLLFNPMLLSVNLDYADFLIEKYLLWNKNSDESEFPDLNAQVE